MQLSLADQRADYGQTVLLPRRQAQVTRTVSRQYIHVAARLTLDLTSSYLLCGGTSRSRATLIYPTPPTGSIGAGDHFPAHRLPQAASTWMYCRLAVLVTCAWQRGKSTVWALHGQ